VEIAPGVNVELDARGKGAQTMRPIRGKIFDIQRFSIHDGPGIRTIIFLKGCPLHCPWCCNPEGISYESELAYYPQRCFDCGECIRVCPQKAIIRSSKDGVSIDREKCNNCGACVPVCSPKALTLMGEEISVDQVMKEVKKDTLFYRVSGGGLTLSGGEPMEQIDFTEALLSVAKQEGINTAVETCGYTSSENFRRVLKNVDYLLYDIKHTDSKKHKDFTGKDNKLILENIELAAQICPSVTARVPYIPGFNSSEKEILEIADFLSSISVAALHILPYHNLGSSKYKSLGKTYQMASTKPVERKKVQRIKRIIEEKYPIKARVGG
jgi:pyruvate formate lyase activating enzyme